MRFHVKFIGYEAFVDYKTPCHLEVYVVLTGTNTII